MADSRFLIFQNMLSNRYRGYFNFETYFALQNIPAEFTDDQNRAPVQIAEQLLKIFANFNHKQFLNITGDKARVYNFEPARKIGNKTWQTKHSKTPVVTKNISTKKVLWCILYSPINPGAKWPSVTGWYSYWKLALKSLWK